MKSQEGARLVAGCVFSLAALGWHRQREWCDLDRRTRQGGFLWDWIVRCRAPRRLTLCAAFSVLGIGPAFRARLGFGWRSSGRNQRLTRQRSSGSETEERMRVGAIPPWLPFLAAGTSRVEHSTPDCRLDRSNARGVIFFDVVSEQASQG